MGSTRSKIIARIMAITTAISAFAVTSTAPAFAAEKVSDGHWLASRCKPARLAFAVRRDNIAGHVTVLYDISAKGMVENIRVTESVPEGLMDMNVENAVKGWRYFAYMQDGAEAARKDVSLTFSFGPDAATEDNNCTHTPLPISTTASLNN